MNVQRRVSKNIFRLQMITALDLKLNSELDSRLNSKEKMECYSVYSSADKNVHGKRLKNHRWEKNRWKKNKKITDQSRQGHVVRYRWENPNNQRYYVVHFSQDLFHDWIVTKVWGTRGTNLGRVTHHPCRNFEEGVQLIDKIAQKRKKHGYLRRDFKGDLKRGIKEYCEEEIKAWKD